MIHFFRKLRSELLQNNRLRQYLIYAFGEIVLVMVGIILALQFSNWNQKRNDVKKEIWYLDNIANDMYYQENNLKELQRIFKEKLSVCNSLLTEYQSTKDYGQIDSLSYKLSSLMVSYSYPNIDNTYRELVSSGQVSLIENNNLISKIIDFYLNSSEIDTMFKINEQQVFYGEVYPIFSAYTEIDISDFTKNQTLLSNDNDVVNYLKKELQSPKAKLDLTNAIKNKLIILTDYLFTVEESIQLAKDMIKAIDKEIGSLQN